MASSLPLTSKPSIKSYSIPRIILLSASSIITTTILLYSLKMFMAFLLCPQTPIIQLNNLLVSNFNVSNSNLAAMWSANLTIYNPNIALSVQMNQIEASILYKYDNALSLTSIDDFELGFGERKDVYVKLVTTGNEGDQPIVEYPLLREIEKEWRQRKMKFRLRVNGITRYEIGWPGWRRRPVIVNPYNIYLDVNIVEDGRRSTGSSIIGDASMDGSLITMVTDRIQV
ncbi:hypothetical protein DITRI_Ditri18aG0072400 [Diplodiscus trichospermus]